MIETEIQRGAQQSDQYGEGGVRRDFHAVDAGTKRSLDHA